MGLPTHVGVLWVPLGPEEICASVGREKGDISAIRGSNTHQLLSWPPGSSTGTQEEQLSLITVTTSGPGCKVLPMAMVGTEPQEPQFKLTAEDLTHSSVVTHLGLLHGACYELVPMDALPVWSPQLCRPPPGPRQDMVAVVIDTGTGFTKSGLTGEDHVLSVVPSCVQLLQSPAQGRPGYAMPED